jgi:hypothetical protein
MLLTSWRMRWKSWKGFYKLASRNVWNTCSITGRSVQLHKGTVLKGMQIKLLYCFVFLRKKVILGTFWSYHIGLLWIMTWKVGGRNGWGQFLHYLIMCMEGPRKTMKNVRMMDLQDWDSCTGWPVYEAGIVSTCPWCLVSSNRWRH